MRRLLSIKLLVLVVSMLAWVFIPATPAQAATSADVTVTAIGYICGPPTGLILTYVSDTEIQIDWTKGVDAENTMIRSAYGRYPTDRNDGNLVYYGDAETASDTSVSLDETATPIYYRLFSERNDGIWNETQYAEDFLEGIGMTLLAFIILGVGLTIAGYWMKNKALSYGAGGAWMVLAGYSYQQSTETWDIFYSLFFIAIAMVIVCMLEPIIQRDNKTKGMVEEVADEADEDLEELRGEQDKTQKQLRSLRFGKRRGSRRRKNRWALTGEEA